MSGQIAWHYVWGHSIKSYIGMFEDISFSSYPLSPSMTVKVPLDAYMIDFVFSEREDGGIFDNKNGMDYHIPVFGGVVKEPPMHIVHITVEMAPIAKVIIGSYNRSTPCIDFESVWLNFITDFYFVCL